MRMQKYCIDLSPQAWKRAGLNGSKFYDKQIHEKLAFGLYLQQQHGNQPTFKKPLHVEATFFMNTPQKRLKDSVGKFDPNRPDLDNLLKFFLDAAVKANILKDDAIVCSVTMKKIYSLEPRTEIIIQELYE